MRVLKTSVTTSKAASASRTDLTTGNGFHRSLLEFVGHCLMALGMSTKHTGIPLSRRTRNLYAFGMCVGYRRRRLHLCDRLLGC